MRFFHLNFLNAWGIFAQKIYNAHAIFCQFSDFKDGARSEELSVLCQLVTGESQRTEITCPKAS